MTDNAENLLMESSSPAGAPQGLPAQFIDPATGEVRLDRLIAAYNDLAARDSNLVEGNLRNIPESFDKYDIKIPSPLLERDDEVLKLFYEKGFTNDQAQLVYDLANERVLPYIEQMTVNFEAERQLEKLASHFGGRDKFNEISRQISAWSKNNLPPEVYDALASTSEGVVALYKMMSSNEPLLGRDNTMPEELNEESLRKMMEDPRYWRDHDKAYVNKITKGFEKLYPGK